MNCQANEKIAQKILKAIQFTQIPTFPVNALVPDLQSESDFPSMKDTRKRKIEINKNEILSLKRVKQSSRIFSLNEIGTVSTEQFIGNDANKEPVEEIFISQQGLNTATQEQLGQLAMEVQLVNSATQKQLGNVVTEENNITVLKDGVVPDLVAEIQTKADAKHFVENNVVGVVGFFRDRNCDLVKNYRELNGVNGARFALGYSEEIFRVFGIETECAILILKRGDEALCELAGDINPEQLHNFVMTNTLPLLIPLSSVTSLTVSKCHISNHFLIITSRKQQLSELWPKIIQEAKEMAKIFKSYILFVTVDLELDENKIFEKYCSNEETVIPSFVMTKSTENMIAYKSKNSDCEINEKISNFFKLFGISDFEQKFIENMPPVKLTFSDNNNISVDIMENDSDSVSAVKCLKQELKDANQLIAVLSNTHNSDVEMENNLPSSSVDFIKSNHISITSLYTNMVAMERQLRVENMAKESLLIEVNKSQSDLMKVCSDLKTLSSENQSLKMKIENQDKIISSCKAICVGNENIKHFQEVLLKEQNKVAEEQSKVLEFARDNSDQDSSGGAGPGLALQVGAGQDLTTAEGSGGTTSTTKKVKKNML